MITPVSGDVRTCYLKQGITLFTKMNGNRSSSEHTVSRRRFILQIGVATACRILINTARRFVYPFAPALARGLDVPFAAVTSLIAVNQVTGMLGPVFAPLGDRRGYRIMLMAGMGLLALGMVVGGVFPVYGVLVAALFMAGLGKSMFDPAIQAYVAERVSFRRRGMIIGTIETAWAGSTLIGVPLVGVLIHHLGWRSPFLVMGVLGILGLAGIYIMVPRGHSRVSGTDNPVAMTKALRTMLCNRHSAGILGFAFFISVANDNFFVIYGVWLEETFDLSVVSLGFTTVVIGVAELCGEMLTALCADRVGLHRSIMGGLALSALSYAVLPLCGHTLVMAMGALFMVFLTVEFSIVTALSLSSEVMPGNRATMMSGYLAAASAGRVVGALLGGAMWPAGKIMAIGFVSTLVTGLALVSFSWGLHHWRT